MTAVAPDWEWDGRAGWLGVGLDVEADGTGRAGGSVSLRFPSGASRVVAPGDARRLSAALVSAADFAEGVQQ